MQKCIHSETVKIVRFCPADVQRVYLDTLSGPRAAEQGHILSLGE